MTPAIQIQGLSKTFRVSGRQIRALQPLDLEVGQGEIFALLGPNGAGKTTLVKILSTLMLPDSGRAQIFEKDLVKDAKEIRQQIGALLGGEDRSFYWRLTGRQNLEVFGALYNLSKKQTRNKIEELSVLFGITDLDQRFDLCSTGQKHRLIMARSFLNDARLIFMDEPTRSLDPLSRLQLRRLIQKMAAEGKTFFFTTHDTREAEELAGRLAILDQGKIILRLSRDEFTSGGVSLEDIFCRIAGANKEESLSSPNVFVGDPI